MRKSEYMKIVIVVPKLTRLGRKLTEHRKGPGPQEYGTSSRLSRGESRHLMIFALQQNT